MSSNPTLAAGRLPQPTSVGPSPDTGPLTTPTDWDRYHGQVDAALIARLANEPGLYDEFIGTPAGRIFELGCGSSVLLARAALRGWDVGGIDYSQPSLGSLTSCLAACGAQTSGLLHGDALTYDVSPLRARYDRLISLGFLEHFEDPVPILERWSAVVAPGGLVVSQVPNLLGVNAPFMRRLDPALWAQHVVYSPERLDEVHVRAGLEVVRPARFVGRYDVHMLIPWDKIEARFPSRQAYRVFKVAMTLGVAPVVRAISSAGSRRLSPEIVGVYRPR